MKCPTCGGETAQSNQFCEFCGAELPQPQKVENNSVVQNITYNMNTYNTPLAGVGYSRPSESSKSKKTALWLCILGGYFGLHYFYAGKIGMGILYMFTVGLFMIGWIIDIFRVLSGSFTDNKGLPIRKE